MAITNEVSSVKIALPEKVYIQDCAENTDKTDPKGTNFSSGVFPEVQQNKTEVFPNLSLGKADKTNDVTHNPTNTNISAQSSAAEKVKKAGLATFVLGLISLFTPLCGHFACEPTFSPLSKKFMLGGLILSVAGFMAALGAKLYSEHIQKKK